LFEKWKDLDASEDTYSGKVEKYIKDIWQFYLDVLKRYLEKMDGQQNPPDRKGNGTPEGDAGEQQGEQQNQNEDDTKGDNKSKRNSDKETEQDENQDEGDTSSGDDPDFEEDDNESEDDSQKASRNKGNFSKHIKDLANKIIFGTDNNYVSTITQIIAERKRQIIAEGNKVALGYSGHINPRAFARPNNNDWKVFKREGGKQLGGGIKKLWLNFFIDASGSYCRNVDETQKVINSFKLASNGGQIFDFQVYTLDTHIHFTKKKYNAFGCNLNSYVNGGEIRNAINKTNHQKYEVVNIILVDGIVSQCDKDKLNNRDIIFLADNDCEYAFNIWYPNAQKIFVSGDYPQELFKEVSKILRRKVN
jgi:hypothetical protein